MSAGCCLDAQLLLQVLQSCVQFWVSLISLTSNISEHLRRNCSDAFRFF